MSGNYIMAENYIIDRNNPKHIADILKEQQDNLEEYIIILVCGEEDGRKPIKRNNRKCFKRYPHRNRKNRPVLSGC